MFATSLALLFLSAPAWAGDKDQDGVPNKTDACKLEAEDKDGFEDEDGCPDPDNDGDGLLDSDDQCPNEAEDKDGFGDEDGCPDPDNDGDGVLDADDTCPDELENDDVKDGCPAVTYELLTTDGWVPAVRELGGLLGENMNAAGCDAAAAGVEAWLAANDPAKLHAVFEARLTRGGEGAQGDLVRGSIEPLAAFWAPAKEAYALYCTEHATWPTVQPKLDGVFQMVGAQK